MLFRSHIEQLGEFDRPFATFIQDLAERGRLANTLVIVMSEFGRTPRINHLVGRDHWSKAWSVVVAGPAPGTRWRANFYRVDYDSQPSTSWSWTPVDGSFHQLSAFGTLIFE